MASAAALSANSCSTNMRIRFFNNDLCRKQQKQNQNLNLIKYRVSSSDQEDCNVEECAPDKEVGKVSMEWLAGEKTKVAGTFPPRRRDWSGYVEKDTAGQTNIYSVEPAVYVAESAISSGSSGTSADGAENTAGVVGFVGLIAVAAASVILLQVGKNPPQIKTLDYAGPSLSYYITKFKPLESSTSAPQIDSEASDTVMSSTSAPQIDSEASDTAISLTSAPQIDSEASDTVMPSTSALQIDSEASDTVMPSTSAIQIDSEASDTEASTENSESAIATPQALEVEVESG